MWWQYKFIVFMGVGLGLIHGSLCFASIDTEEVFLTEPSGVTEIAIKHNESSNHESAQQEVDQTLVELRKDFRLILNSPDSLAFDEKERILQRFFLNYQNVAQLEPERIQRFGKYYMPTGEVGCLSKFELHCMARASHVIPSPPKKRCHPAIYINSQEIAQYRNKNEQ